MAIYPTLCELAGLPVPKHVEGSRMVSLLRDPQAAWDTPAITTHGYQNHTVRSEAWRYIRYADGSEELYDEAKDPYEWTNLAAKPEFAPTKAELAKWLPTKNVLPNRSGRAGRGDANLTRPVATERKPKKKNSNSERIQ